MSAEDEFVGERAREYLVEWATRQVCGENPVIPEKEREGRFAAWALQKGWISSNRDRVLAVGFKTAAAFLRR